jgi:ABC-type transporter Mla subunit MlaD
MIVMTRNKIFGAGLVALLLCLGFIPILQASAQQDKTKAEQFIQIADRSREHVVLIRDMVASKGVSTSKMDALIADADSLLKEAKTFLADNKLSDALAKATAAMRKYTEAIRSLGETLRPDAREVEKQRTEVERRENERIGRIRAAVKAVPNAPQSIVKEVNDRLVEAEGAMKNAPAKRPEARPASPKTAEALDSVRKLENWQMAQRIIGYLRGVDAQIQKIAGDIETAAKRGANVESLQKHLAELQQLVEGAKKKVIDGDRNVALKDIGKIQELLNNIKREIIPISRPVQERPNRGP